MSYEYTLSAVPGLKKFADGQWTCEPPVDAPIIKQITAALTSYDSLFALAAATQAYKPTTLIIVSLIGGRSDKKKRDNASFDLKIICQFVNSLNYEKVVVLQPHSDVTMALLNNSIERSFHWWKYVDPTDYVVSPDAGAYKRLMHEKERYGFPHVIVPAVKYRSFDNEPRTILAVGEGHVIDSSVRYTIVDDLCDGGRTFTQLAAQIRSITGGICDTLAVAHGLFTYGLEPLALAGFKKIITTNSYDHTKVMEQNTLIDFIEERVI